MLTTEDLPTILTALEAYKGDRARDLRPALRDRIYELSFGSPVDTIVKTAETLYAAGDEVGAAGRQMAAELFYAASYHGWHGVNAEGRAARIIAAIRRDLGEDAPVMGWPDPATDPDARAEFVVADPEPAPPADAG